LFGKSKGENMEEMGMLRRGREAEMHQWSNERAAQLRQALEPAVRTHLAPAAIADAESQPSQLPAVQ